MSANHCSGCQAEPEDGKDKIPISESSLGEAPAEPSEVPKWNLCVCACRGVGTPLGRGVSGVNGRKSGAFLKNRKQFVLATAWNTRSSILGFHSKNKVLQIS